MICALLLGRHGSAGFPGKNIYPVLGRPLIAYPLMAARDAQSVDRTYVSTDSAALASIAAQYGAWIASAARLDFGRSWLYDRPVSEIIPDATAEQILIAAAALIVETEFGKK